MAALSAGEQPSPFQILYHLVSSLGSFIWFSLHFIIHLKSKALVHSIITFLSNSSSRDLQLFKHPSGLAVYCCASLLHPFLCMLSLPLVIQTDRPFGSIPSHSCDILRHCVMTRLFTPLFLCTVASPIMFKTDHPLYPFHHILLSYSVIVLHSLHCNQVHIPRLLSFMSRQSLSSNINIPTRMLPKEKLGGHQLS